MMRCIILLDFLSCIFSYHNIYIHTISLLPSYHPPFLPSNKMKQPTHSPTGTKEPTLSPSTKKPTLSPTSTKKPTQSPPTKSNKKTPKPTKAKAVKRRQVQIYSTNMVAFCDLGGGSVT